MSCAYTDEYSIPTDSRRCPNVVLILGRHRRRWASIKTTLGQRVAVADPECARGGGVSHILAEKRGVSFILFQKLHENAIFSPKRGGGRTPGTPYAGSATGVVLVRITASKCYCESGPTLLTHPWVTSRAFWEVTMQMTRVLHVRQERNTRHLFQFPV